MTREELLEKENNLLKEVIAIEAQLGNTDTTPSSKLSGGPNMKGMYDISSMRALLFPPKVGPEFYTGDLSKIRVI